MFISETETREKLKRFAYFLEKQELENAIEELFYIFTRLIRERQHFVSTEQIEKLIIEMREGFKRIDIRFEEMDKRFSDLIQMINKRFEEQNHYMNKRFEEINKRFEEQNHHINKRFQILQWFMTLLISVLLGFTTFFYTQNQKINQKIFDILSKIYTENIKPIK